MGNQSDTEFDQLLASDLAKVKLKLSSHVRFYEQVNQGEICVVVHNTLSDKQFSTTPIVKVFAQEFFHEKTLREVLLKHSYADDLSSQEWVDLLSNLINSDVLISSDLQNDMLKFELFEKQGKAIKRGVLSKPWMIKIPLFNPDAFLTFLNNKFSFVWTKAALLIWLSVVSTALISVTQHFDALATFWNARFLDPGNLVIAFLAYLVLKYAHELGHGLAAKNWGARVAETGVIFIFFIPLPYIDVSQSSIFSKKYQRVMVSSAGMVVELFIAAVAYFVWSMSELIYIQDVCINIMLIGAISSILFNINPLLKFDGYYIFSDLVEIQNLSQKANSLLQQRLIGLFVGSSDNVYVAESVREYRWLIFYGLTSFFYRILLSLAIAIYISGHYIIFGLLLAVWMLVAQIFKPFLSLIALVFKEAIKQKQMGRAILMSLVVSLFVFGSLFFVPIKSSTVVEGLVTLDGSAQIIAKADGFIDKLDTKSEAFVKRGDALLSLNNDNLISDIRLVDGKISELETLIVLNATKDPPQAEYYRDLLITAKQEKQDLEDQQKSLSITSPLTGTFYGDNLSHRVGTYVKKGEVLGSVLNSNALRVLAVSSEKQMNKLEHYERVLVNVHFGPSFSVLPVDVIKTPSALTTLPNKFLGSLYGGDVAVDASAKRGDVSLKPVFQFEIPFPKNVQVPAVTGARVTVKFVHSNRPLGFQLGEWVVNKIESEGLLSKF